MHGCIFCGSRSPSRSISHIVPESFGGQHSPVASSGTTCDRCNQYFGQKVEASALRSFPFSAIRLMTGIPSKKGSMSSIETTLGRIQGVRDRPLSLELEPRSERLAHRVVNGEFDQVRILAEVTEPLAVCRMLLKMGLELLAKHFYDVAISDRFREARQFARQPARGARWWCILQSDPHELLGHRVAEQPAIEIVEAQDVITFVFRFPGITAMVPLEANTESPSMFDLSEPEYRIVLALC